MNPNPHIPPASPFQVTWIHITEWWKNESPEFQEKFPVYDNGNGQYNYDVLLAYNKTYYPQYCDVGGKFNYDKWADANPDVAKKMLLKPKPKLAPEIKRFINRV